MRNPLSKSRRIARMLTSGTAGNRDYAFEHGQIFEFLESVPELEVFIDNVRGEWITEADVQTGKTIYQIRREHVHRDAALQRPDDALLSRVEICKRFRWSDDAFDVALRLGFPKPVALRGRQRTFSGIPEGPQEHVWAPRDVDNWRADVEVVAGALVNA